ncbi:MAG: response regulator [Trueperaceae bacterium]
MSERAILVVDSDPLQRQLIDVLLADPNAVVVEAGTAREALEYLKEHTPDLAIVAYELPDLDGAELTDRLKRVSRLAHVPVLMTTSPRDGLGVAPALRAKARAAGVDLLIPKPLGDKNVRERSRRLMAERTQIGRHPTDPAARHGEERSTLVLDEALVSLDEAGGVVPYDGSPLGHGHGAHRDATLEPSAAPGAGSDAAGLRQELAALQQENAALRQSIEDLRRQLGGGRNEQRDDGTGRNARRGRGAPKRANDS